MAATVVCALGAAAVAVLPVRPVSAAGGAGTVQDFDADGVGTPYVSHQVNNPPGPTLLPGGPLGTGRFLRVAPAESPTAVPPISNNLGFATTAPGPQSLVVADFDLRMTPGDAVPGAIGRADGMGFALLSTATYGNSGSADNTIAPYVPEEPNLTGSLGIGFDIYRSNHPGGYPPDIGNVNVAGDFSNSISVHWNGALVAQRDVSPVTDLGRGSWIHARVIVDAGAGRVSVLLSACSNQAIVVVDSVAVPGLAPYEGRAWFGGRSGGRSAHHDLDNVNVQYLAPTESVVSFGGTSYEAAETGGQALTTLRRAGNTGSAVSVVASTANLTATAGADYTAQSVTVSFAAGEVAKTAAVPVSNDATDEGDEGFLVRLSGPTGAALVGGPSATLVTIKDDERARVAGQWAAPQCLPVVAVHTSVLPTGKVLMWDRFAVTRVWDPATGAVTVPSQPGNEIFCSGHAFTADGRLLVTGGHGDPNGAPTADGIGLRTASCYDPFADAWSAAPDMNAARWYPTNTTLGNGDVLVLSGSVDAAYTKNTLPQVWSPGGASCGTWRSLTGAQQLAPLGGDLYPRMFLAPDGRVFKAGPDPDTWFLTTDGVGSWSPGPASTYGLRTYGTAVMYEPGKVLIAGGSKVQPGNVVDPPTATAERIDLNAASPAWAPAGLMNVARRHLDATVLTDGTVLVTGGTSGGGFNNESTPVLPAESWNPVSGTWSLMAAMTVPRTYHSTAVLLPDGRVLAAGGGEGAGATEQHSEAEVFSPPYLFKGPRPVISSAPAQALYGQTILVGTGQAASIQKASLVRLPSVTHAFDQNARYLPLPVAAAGGGVNVTIPSDPDLAPPGQYMLFLVDSTGVPSIARILKVAGPVEPSNFDGDGDTDTTVFRDGVWYVKTPTPQTVAWGVAGDVPVPGDYDGDGDTDAAVFRNGTWYLRTATPQSFAWGMAGDIPVPADYDGDGITDPAVFRNGIWYVKTSTAPPQSFAWGVGGDTPVPGDYNGDGTVDAAVFRNGTWYLRAPTPQSFAWGVGGDTPVPGDYNGDGTVDAAVFRNGTWYLRTPTPQSLAWGTAGDKPQPGDYNGDRVTDPAVYRAGTWYLRTPAPDTFAWGVASDVPQSLPWAIYRTLP